MNGRTVGKDGYLPLDSVSRRRALISPISGQEAYLKALEHEISQVSDEESSLRLKLDEVQNSWDIRRETLETRLESMITSRKKKEQELKQVMKPTHKPDERPGPECLNWVEGTKFMLLCSAVIIANMITLVVELNHPHEAHSTVFWTLDQLFLIFYVTELILKSLLMHQGLLIGQLGEVWWNWLDLIIVVSGVMDQWLKPLAVKADLVDMGSDEHGSPSILSFLRMLRLMRLARILKLVRVFLLSELSWTEGHHFQGFIMCIIGINSILMGFEVDYPDFAGWYYIEQVLLVIYFFEVSVRLKRWGLSFFCHPQDMAWNVMDFLIVLGGVVDQWMVPFAFLVLTLLTGKVLNSNTSMGQIMVLLRMARLLRVLRLVRLIKSIPPLFNLVMGIMEAMQGMTWVLVLTIVLLYAFAILATRLIGHGLLFSGEPPDEAEEIFPCVPEAMFVLFKVMNGDQTTIAPLFEFIPLLKVFFVLFMIASSWAILSILTAVVSENMLKVTERTHVEQEEMRVKMENIRCIERLSEIFSDLDKNGNGSLDEREFSKLLLNHTKSDELCEVAGLGKHELADLFDILSKPDPFGGGPRTIMYQDFITGLQKEKDPVTMKAAMRIEKRLRDLGGAQDEMREQLEFMGGRVRALEVQATMDRQNFSAMSRSRTFESSPTYTSMGSSLSGLMDPLPPPSGAEENAGSIDADNKEALPQGQSAEMTSRQQPPSQRETDGKHKKSILKNSEKKDNIDDT